MGAGDVQVLSDVCACVCVCVCVCVFIYISILLILSHVLGVLEHNGSEVLVS